MSYYDNYEEQAEQLAQEAYNAAMIEAGREADRVQSEHDAYVAELERLITENEIIYVLHANNGDSYENYEHWVGGIFKTYEEAFEEGKKISLFHGADRFTVSQWLVGEKSELGYVHVENLRGEWRGIEFGGEPMPD